MILGLWFVIIYWNVTGCSLFRKGSIFDLFPLSATVLCSELLVYIDVCIALVGE